MHTLTILLVFATSNVTADTADTPADFELPGADLGALPGDGGLELGDAELTGNPFRKLAGNWPEDLVIAPIPGRSPQMGWKMTLAGVYFLGTREEGAAPPSVLGGFAMFAENGSYAYGAGANLRFFDDRLRVRAGAGYADVRYRFYGIGNDAGRLGVSVDILQEAPLNFASASWRVWNRLYVGAGYLAGDVESRLRITLPDPSPFFDPSLDVDIAAYVIPIEYDKRDHEQFPRDGWLVNGRAMLYRKSAGSDFDAETFQVDVNHYRPLRQRDVLALRAYLRSTNGSAPFFLLSTFGGGTDLRGYPSGRYRDRMMYAVQGEYRWQYTDRWIFTGFAGVGEVAEDFGDFGDNYLPAAGLGARFVISQKHRVSLSADVARGRDGTEFYVGVGEAF